MVGSLSIGSGGEADKLTTSKTNVASQHAKVKRQKERRRKDHALRRPPWSSS